MLACSTLQFVTITHVISHPTPTPHSRFIIMSFSMLPPECYDQIVGFLRYKDVSVLKASEELRRAGM